ncbi:MAG: hypothetical protein HY553_19930, partial [Elusimicrobia bacterium]|nr:hypothetical protein [Elusimicrobiota bacterium]
MRIRVHNARLLPAAARRVPLLAAACRSALGPAARKRGELNVVFLRKGKMRRINRDYL